MRASRLIMHWRSNGCTGACFGPRSRKWSDLWKAHLCYGGRCRRCCWKWRPRGPWRPFVHRNFESGKYSVWSPFWPDNVKSCWNRKWNTIKSDCSSHPPVPLKKHTHLAWHKLLPTGHWRVAFFNDFSSCGWQLLRSPCIEQKNWQLYVSEEVGVAGHSLTLPCKIISEKRFRPKKHTQNCAHFRGH